MSVHGFVSLKLSKTVSGSEEPEREGKLGEPGGKAAFDSSERWSWKRAILLKRSQQ
jgi:hypothetical protein